MTFPLDITTELQIDGVWTDVSADVLQRDPIKIKRGRPNESSRAGPSTCSVTLDNRSGNYSPRNPTGAYYGLLGRNTPLRVSVNGGVRFTGEVPAWPPLSERSGSDVWVSVTASGIMRRLGQGQAFLQSALRRGVPGLPSLVAYWPCEDGEGATQLASALPGKPAMTLNGSVEAASFDGFEASEPIPTAAGVVTWTGPVAAYVGTNEAQIRFLLAVPEAGVASTLRLCHFTDATAEWVLTVDTAGALTLTGSNASILFSETSGALSFDVEGRLLLVSVELTSDGTADVDWTVSTLEVGATTGTTFSGTGTALAGTYNVGAIQSVVMNHANSFAAEDEVALGHVWVQSEVTNIDDMADLLAAYAGETAGARVTRLCGEESVGVTIVGTSAATAPVGSQLPRTLLDLLREAAAADGGILYEPRDSLGLAYRTRADLYCQDATLEVDYSAQDLSRIEPTEDDQATRNDVTVSRIGGASARVELATGSMSVNDPPDGVGRYDDSVSLNLAYDAQLPHQAGWRLHLGTVDEARFPAIGVNLARSNFTSEVGNYLTANQASMETSVADWSAGGSVPPTLSQSNTRAQDGTQSLRIAWGTGGVLPLAQTTVTGLTIGRTYTVSAYGYVPTGDPGLALVIAGIGGGSAMTTKDAFTRFTKTFTATATSHVVQVWPTPAPTAGDLAWVDAVQVWEGSAAVTFTTALATTTQTVQAEGLDLGDKITVANLPTWVSPDDTAQLAQGLTETLTPFDWQIEANCSPASPWDVAVYGDTTGPGEARYSSSSTTLNEALDTTETGVDIATSYLWTAVDQPFDIVIGGERMTVTAVTGSSSPQTLTVTRSVNGVVKSHASGAAVRLFKPAVYAL
ncbi:MAG: hypothetical protein EPO65_00590 [Dehalococcoidia bacterium]|nr:MAG: hypothetical protein EPO65_00590 [Dehalococcoidia bacterium]